MGFAGLATLAAALALAAPSGLDRSLFPEDADARGFRAAAAVLPRKGAPVRIVCLGDSHTYGYGVRAEQAYPRILESRLNAAAGSRRFEAVNAGLSGSCILEKRRLYQESCSGLAHDWVILQVGMDLHRLALHIREDRRQMGLLWRVARRLRDGFPGSRAARELWAWALRWESGRLESRLLLPEQAPLLAESRQAFIAQLDRLYAEVRRNHARLLILDYDSGPYDAQLRACLDVSRAKAVPRLHVSHQDFDPGEFLPDGHLGPAGYEELVGALLRAFAGPLLGRASPPRAALAARSGLDRGNMPADMNPQGFRAKGEVPARRRGPQRVFCVGDAATYGDGVRADQAYPKLLEGRLNAAVGSRRFEVVNAGLGGTCILEKWRTYRESCSGLDHDWVLLEVGMDLPRIALQLRADRRQAGLFWRLCRRLREGFPDNLWARRLWEYALRRENGWVERRLLLAGQAPLLAESQRIFTSTLDRFSDEARRNHARLLILDYNSGPYEAATRACISASRAKAVPLVLVAPERFEARAFLPDSQLSPKGHDDLAGKVMEAFAELFLGWTSTLQHD
ncbi:MAG: hypothetical protein NTY77_20845 [Elusimicrobia bacterium]|nr:hypothetical protein [Elusimicrobiota bacterium]